MKKVDIRVFLGYAEEDRVAVKRLSRGLQRAGFEPWMDQEELLAGQNWPLAIEQAIDRADFFVACFSRRSVARRGHFHRELNYAITVAASVPAEEIYLLPVRLDDCELPREIRNKIQHVDLFPDWERGLVKLAKAMWQQTLERSRK